MAKSPTGTWAVWPVGETAIGAIPMHTSRGRVVAWGKIMVKRHKPQWVGRELVAYLPSHGIEIRFTV